MDLALLGNMSIILITAVIVLLVFNKLKLPTMIGLFFYWNRAWSCNQRYKPDFYRFRTWSHISPIHYRS
ncbi:hypothetical protein [uncultured Methanobrevibacter sp.]|uniref:hypothetical protein n=1 Tax=uncultured Methanobrevibacter sp. TaxID=253161 RepID=UPI0025F6B8BB|nr:hypothetical protein [uncultured Methanobrevibacter sp.]